MSAPAVEPRSSESQFRWKRAGDEVVAEWAGFFTLRASAKGILKSLEPAPHLTRQAVEKLEHGFAAAFLRSLRGAHSLHASAVALESGALLCLGASGGGKSTVAECLCRQAGAHLLADDIAAIERVESWWQVAPSEASHWLEGPSSKQKVALPSLRVAGRPATVRWIVDLRFDDEGNKASQPVVRRLRRSDAVARLLDAMLRFEATRDVWVQELDAVAAIASGAVACELTRSRGVSCEAVAEAIAAMIRGRA